MLSSPPAAESTVKTTVPENLEEKKEQTIVSEVKSVTEPVSTLSVNTSSDIDIGGVDTSLAKLEARCKRFGIPFDPSKYINKEAKPTNQQASSEVYNSRLIDDVVSAEIAGTQKAICCSLDYCFKTGKTIKSSRK